MTDTRRALLDDLSDELTTQHRGPRVMVAIDGVDGAVTAPFADAWAEVLRERGVFVVRASVDDFPRPSAERQIRAAEPADSSSRDAFDVDAVRTQLIVPFRSGESTVATGLDDRAEASAHRIVDVPELAVLLVDGVFLHSPELVQVWHRSVWLEVAGDLAAARVPAGEAQARYRREVAPQRAATIVIDYADPAHPARTFADFC